VEWVNVRLKIFWGTDDGNATGVHCFHAFIRTVLVVHLVFATLLAKAPRWKGRLYQRRLGPVVEALCQADQAPAEG
jgi:hypothetical protein